MKKIIGSCLLVLTLAMVSCSKEKSVDTSNGTGSGTGSGTDTGTGTGGTGSTSYTYQPVTTNSYWKYKYTAGYTGESSGSISGKTVTNNGVVYYEISSAVNTTAKSYYGIKDRNYYMKAAGVSPSTGAPVDLYIHYLNDTASVGYTWNTDAGSGNGFKAYIDGEIKERDLTLTVQGKTYKEVIHSSVVLSYDILGTIMSFGGYEFYVAKNIGVVKLESIVGFPGASTTIVQELVDYTIK